MRRYRRKTKRSFRKRTTRKRKGISLATRVKKIIAQSTEVKMTQNEYPTASVTTTPVILVLPVWPAQGIQGIGDDDDVENTQSQRIGNEIYIKKICVRFACTMSGVARSNVFRIIFFQWKEDTRHDEPDVGSILDSPSDGYSFLSPYNITTAAKYKILYDRTFSMYEQSNSAQIVRTLNFYGKKIPIKKIRFATNVDSGPTANVIKGDIFYMLMSDASEETPSFILSQTMYYTDA